MPAHTTIHHEIETQNQPSAEAQKIVSFWFSGSAPEQRWFTRNPDFDKQIASLFLDQVLAARAGKLDAWEKSPLGSLALILLLDQFPRNLFRGKAAAFESDDQALKVATYALARGDASRLSPKQRTFLYLPFEHSENLTHQIGSVALFEKEWALAQDDQQKSYAKIQLTYAQRHLEAILKFGRFPGRNQALKRDSTAEEDVFLSEHAEGF